MATAVVIAPGTATLTPATGGAILAPVVGRAALTALLGAATLRGGVLNDAHIQTTSPPAPTTGTAAVGSAVVGTSTVG